MSDSSITENRTNSIHAKIFALYTQIRLFNFWKKRKKEIEEKKSVTIHKKTVSSFLSRISLEDAKNPRKKLSYYHLREKWFMDCVHLYVCMCVCVCVCVYVCVFVCSSTDTGYWSRKVKKFSVLPLNLQIIRNKRNDL